MVNVDGVSAVGALDENRIDARAAVDGVIQEVSAGDERVVAGAAEQQILTCPAVE